jgi:hypothetical protein
VTLGLGLSVVICTMVFTSWFPQEINTLDLQLRKGQVQKYEFMLPRRKSRNFWIFYNLTSHVSSGSLSTLGFEKPICPKLYYQCYPTEFRKDEHIALWTPEAELRYRRAVLDGSFVGKQARNDITWWDLWEKYLGRNLTNQTTSTVGRSSLKSLQPPI